MSLIKNKRKDAPKKKKEKVVYDPEEEKGLEKQVFADPDDVFEHLESEEEKGLEKLVFADPDDVFEHLESETAIKIKELSSDDDSDLESLQFLGQPKRKPAWTDDDDDYSIKQALKEQKRKLPGGERPEQCYNELLQKKFKNIVGEPDWAKLQKKEEKSDESEDEDGILKHSSHIGIKKSTNLVESVLEIKVLRNLNSETHSEGLYINCVQFHPTSMVAFVAGSAGVLSLFKVDGKENIKLHSIKFEKFPICCASFIKNGDEIIVSNMTLNFFHAYNLITGVTRKVFLPYELTSMKLFRISPNEDMIAVKGRFGEIHILDSTTFELMFSLKMNRNCQALGFTPDNQYLITHGDCQDMYVWDLQTHRCINRANDEGCISCSSLAISPSGQFLATGSKQGVVNIYNLSDVIKSPEPKPLKSIMNLVTAITELKFNPQSEILAIISRDKENAFKMVHLPSFKVFKNFPNFRTVLHKPLNVAFSPGSGFMSVTNNKGIAYLYKLKHYGNY